MLCMLYDTTRYSIQRPYILQRNSSAVFWSDKLSMWRLGTWSYRFVSSAGQIP